MKKLIMFCFAVTVLASCGTSKVVKEAKSTFKGAWTLNTITYPGASGDLQLHFLMTPQKRVLKTVTGSLLLIIMKERIPLQIQVVLLENAILYGQYKK